MENARICCAACPDRCGYAMVLVQLWQPVVFCEFFRTCSGDTMWLAFLCAPIWFTSGCKNR
jgi:hypothetical protein